MAMATSAVRCQPPTAFSDASATPSCACAANLTQPTPSLPVIKKQMTLRPMCDGDFGCPALLAEHCELATLPVMVAPSQSKATGSSLNLGLAPLADVDSVLSDVKGEEAAKGFCGGECCTGTCAFDETTKTYACCKSLACSPPPPIHTECFIFSGCQVCWPLKLLYVSSCFQPLFGSGKSVFQTGSTWKELVCRPYDPCCPQLLVARSNQSSHGSSMASGWLSIWKAGCSAAAHVRTPLQTLYH